MLSPKKTMNREFSNARQLFSTIVELRSDDEREALLDEVAAHSPEMAQKVRELLKAHAEAKNGEFFAANPRWQDEVREAGDVDQLKDERAEGSTIGRYKLLQQIGEGGMGDVWMAEQREPVERKVALKIIKAGMDTKQVVARFEAERQALALMDHPHIARVLDGGATEQGRPYFVMELVQGCRSPSTPTRPNSRRGSGSGFSSKSAGLSNTPIKRGSFTATSNQTTSWWPTTTGNHSRR